MSGIGTIDVKLTVDTLIAAAKAKNLNPLLNKRDLENLRLNVFNNLTTLVTNFQSSLSNVSDAFNQVSYNALSSDPTTLTATVTSNALNQGTHTVSVTTLAAAQADTSANFASQTNALGISGPLTFTTGSETFTVNISSNESLQSVMNDINNATDNYGISANIIGSTATDGSTQYTLVVGADDTGTSNAFTVSGGAATGLTLAQTTAAQDATFTFDGYNEVRSSNTINDVMDGLTFNLLSAGKTATLNITQDTTNKPQAISKAINDFIANYNGVIQYLDASAAYQGTNVPQIQFVKSILQGAMNAAYGNGAIQSLAQAGLKLSPHQEQINPSNNKTYTTTGSIQINTDTYKNGLDLFDYNTQFNYDDLQSFFNDPNTGLINAVKNVISNRLLSTEVADGSEGVITGGIDMTNTLLGYINDDLTSESNKIKLLEEKLTDKYSLLNAKLKSFELISNALEKQLSVLNNTFGSKK